MGLAVITAGVALFASTTPASAASGDHLWSKRFGDAADFQVGHSVAVDSSGNVFATGEFLGSVDFGGGALTSVGNTDIYLAKFDPAGNPLWSKRFGDANVQTGHGVAVDSSGNVFVTGEFRGSVNFGGGPLTSAGDTDVYLAKFDPAGNHLWSKRFGDADGQIGHGVAVDSTGNVLITGEFYGTVDFGGGPLTTAGLYDIFLAKFNSAGNPLWSKRFGPADYQYSYAVAVDSSDNVLITGDFNGSVDFGGGTLTSAGFSDIFLAKFDSGGNPLWSKRFGSSFIDYGTGVAADSSGNVLLTGNFYGSADFGGGKISGTFADAFLAKFDPTGSHLWSKGFGDPGQFNSQIGESVSSDSSGNVLATGSFQGSVDFGGGPLSATGGVDIYLAEFDPAGSHLWSKRFGGGSDDVGLSVAVDGGDNVLLTGWFSTAVDFGGGPLTSMGARDIFLAKFAGEPAAATATGTPTPGTTPPPALGGVASHPQLPTGGASSTAIAVGVSALLLAGAGVFVLRRRSSS